MYVHSTYILPIYTNSTKFTEHPISLQRVFNSIIFLTLDFWLFKSKKNLPISIKVEKTPFQEASKYWKLFRCSVVRWVAGKMSPIKKNYQNTKNLIYYHMDYSQHDSVFCNVHAVLILWMVLTVNLFLCQRWQFLHQFQKLLQKPGVLNHSDRIAQPKGSATEKLIH